MPRKLKKPRNTIKNVKLKKLKKPRKGKDFSKIE